MKRLLFAILSLVPAVLIGQNTIKGVVLDSLTRDPLPSATVYVNGTTQGVATDANGRFELKDVSLPATIVFSFVGYETQAIDLVRSPGELTIRLKTNDELPEIVVSGKLTKADKKDLEYFKNMFLGDDRWGKHATIKNEYSLIFDKSEQISYTIRRISKTSFSIPTVNVDLVEKHVENYDTVKVRKSLFSARASEPIIIDLPLLGYEVYVDLVKFTVVEKKAQTYCDMLGYFYYKPYDNVNKRKSQSYENNRKRAYYGSIQHFLRSLSDNRFAENGYILTTTEKVQKGKKVMWIDIPVDLGKYSSDEGENILIHGLKDKNLKIKYYYRDDGSPYFKGDKFRGIRFYSESGMTFLEDTCIFFKDGTVMDNNIAFTGELSNKKVGACLPGDYRPPEDTSRKKISSSADHASELIRFADNIRDFNGLFPQEKVYLEFDNTAYFQGENIWFKAFATHATTLEQAPSGVLYVDFLAPTGQLILQQKLKIEAGQADGTIPLIDAGTMQTREKQGILAYPSGFYEIRAYTQNMLDFSPEAIFSRVIPVYTQPKYEGEYDRSHVEDNQDNPLVEKIRGKSVEQKRNVNVSFYPEGGDLVSDLPCRVAFKATDSDGFGIDGALVFSGIQDSVFTVHDGMGSFIITPYYYETTTAEFISSDGKRTLFDLPKSMGSGYSMMVDMNSDSQMQVNIWRTDDCMGEKTALAVTCRGDVIHFEEIKDIDNSQLIIDCSDWPVGVCRVTLYNREGKILSSRSIFHNSSELPFPAFTLNTDSMSRQSCDKEVIEFKLTDQVGNPLRDRFCLSVRDATDYGGGQTDNLQINLLLSSDLRGYIHDPAWYLEANDEEHREALNLLTLVQGWERYEWQYMTGLKEFEERHRVEEGLTMNGWILSYGRRVPVSDIGVYASIIPEDDKKLFESFDYQTDSTGYFGFDLSDFYGRGKFTINLMSTKKAGDSKYEKSKRIRFERADRPNPRPYLKQEMDLNHNDHRAYDYKVDYTDFDLTPAQRRKLGRMIDDVDIEEESQKRRFIDYDTFTSFEAEEDAELELDQGEYTTDLEGYFLDKGIRFFREGEPEGRGLYVNLSLGDEYVNADNYQLLDSEENDNGDGENNYGEKNNNGMGNNRIMRFEDFENIFSAKTNKAVGISPFFYIHNNEKVLYHKPFDDPMRIDMIDVKSIIVFDRPMYIKDIANITPLLVDLHIKHCDTDWLRDITLDGGRRYTLLDIQIKEDRELLFYNEIRNLGRRTTTVKGFTRPVQYYSPVYPDGPIEGKVDTRRTLYWNPNVITDEYGHARVEFYNNSFTRKFTISAAGITASGIPYILNEVW